MFYVCNSPDPMVVPVGVNAQLFATLEEGQQDALRRAAQQPSSLSWYVHEFGLSSVVFRASSVITVDSEVLSGPANPV